MKLREKEKETLREVCLNSLCLISAFGKNERAREERTIQQLEENLERT